MLCVKLRLWVRMIPGLNMTVDTFYRDLFNENVYLRNRWKSEVAIGTTTGGLFAATVLNNDEFLKLSLCGLASLLIFQTFIHIGVNTSLLPTTGMTLPFLSYGGSSLIGSAILAGVILNYTKLKLENYD